jgi:transposase
MDGGGGIREVLAYRIGRVRRAEEDRLVLVVNGWRNEQSAVVWLKKIGPNPTDRGKQGVKRSLLTEAAGIPLALSIDGANRHDMKLVRNTLDNIMAPRPAPTAGMSQGLCLDKGDDFDEVRDIIKAFGLTAHIRARGEETRAIKQEAGFKARRWVVERTHSWMNRFRRILVRWERLPQTFIAMPHLACGIITWRATGLGTVANQASQITEAHTAMKEANRSASLS